MLKNSRKQKLFCGTAFTVRNLHWNRSSISLLQDFSLCHLVRVTELRQNSEADIQLILSRMRTVLFNVAAAAFFHRTTKPSTKSSVLEVVIFADFGSVFSISLRRTCVIFCILFSCPYVSLIFVLKNLVSHHLKV